MRLPAKRTLSRKASDVQRNSLEDSKYDLSPTTTNMLSQSLSKNPEASTVFATSFNKLPSVVSSQESDKNRASSLVRALFKATSGDSLSKDKTNDGQQKDKSVISLL